MLAIRKTEPQSHRGDEAVATSGFANIHEYLVSPLNGRWTRYDPHRTVHATRWLDLTARRLTGDVALSGAQAWTLDSIGREEILLRNIFLWFIGRGSVSYCCSVSEIFLFLTLDL